MPSLAEYHSRKYVKILAMGSPKSGKTGSLVSLVKAGYKLRILDFDLLLDPLIYFLEKEAPDKIKDVEVISLRDQYIPSHSGPVIAGKPRAFAEAIKILDDWPGLGCPAEWGEDCVLVIDSLSRLCDAAFDLHECIIPRGKTGEYDTRSVYQNAQNAVEKMIAMLTSDGFGTNVIVTAHIDFFPMPGGVVKGFPTSVGKKLSPQIGGYFPTIILYTNQGEKRTIRTTSTNMIDLANPKPFAIAEILSIETGLSEIFNELLNKETNDAETQLPRHPGRVANGGNLRPAATEGALPHYRGGGRVRPDVE